MSKMNYTFSGRYTDILKDLLDDLNATKELKIKYEDDCQGNVDVSVLLADGRVFSYEYYYGSCSGCDEWEDRQMTDLQIKIAMLHDATIFDNIQHYEEFERERKNT